MINAYPPEERKNSELFGRKFRANFIPIGCTRSRHVPCNGRPQEGVALKIHYFAHLQPSRREFLLTSGTRVILQAAVVACAAVTRDKKRARDETANFETTPFLLSSSPSGETTATHGKLVLLIRERR